MEIDLKTLRSNTYIEVVKSKHPLKLMFNNNKHEANIDQYHLIMGDGKRDIRITNLSYGDLKELRKVIRRVIKDESK